MLDDKTTQRPGPDATQAGERAPTTPAAERPGEVAELARRHHEDDPPKDGTDDPGPDGGKDDAEARKPDADADDGKSDGQERGRKPDEPKPDGDEKKSDDDKSDEDGKSGKDGESGKDDKSGKDGKEKEGDGKDGDDDKRSTLARARDAIRRHKVVSAIAAIAVVAAIIGGVVWYLIDRHWESTDDAFVDARIFSISPKVSGYLFAVPVTDNQHVDAGGLVAQIDTRDFDVALEQANAQVLAAQASVQSAIAQLGAQEAQIAEARAQVTESEAALSFAQDEDKRAQELVQKGAGTGQRAQQTASQLTQSQATLARTRAALNAAFRQVAVLEGQGKSAEANLSQAKAQRDQAVLNLSYTQVKADQPGRIARLTAAKGQLVQAGQALTMFVPDSLWVTANYKETQLTDMRPGQEVEMRIDAYPDRKIKGRVDSIQRGSGTVFSLLPAQNATGNYVKVVQRVPVKLAVDNWPSDVAIGPGMSVVPSVRVR